MSPDPDVSSVVQSTQHLSTSPWVPGIGAISGQVCKPQGNSWPRELPPALLVCSAPWNPQTQQDWAS